MAGRSLKHTHPPPSIPPFSAHGAAASKKDKFESKLPSVPLKSCLLGGQPLLHKLPLLILPN